MKINSKIKGVTFRNPIEEDGGLTLFTTATDKMIYLIDMKGRLVHKWEVELAPIYKAELLKNGNLIYTGKVGNGPMSHLEDAAGRIIEVDWDNNIVWEYEDDHMHNSFYRKKNGNILYFKWNKLPEEVSKKVKGGNPKYSENGVVWGDTICEINKYKRVVWEWNAWEHVDIDKNIICLLDSNIEWTHASSMYISSDGNIVVNFKMTNTIIKVNPETKEIVWDWGPGETAHANVIAEATDFNFIIFDNGFHYNGLSPEFSRVFELNTLKDKIVWEYTDTPFTYFHSSVYGCCQRLENGNTLICDSTNGRLLEVNRKREIVWEYVNPYYSQGEKFAKNNIIVFANRYYPDYSAFKNKNWLI
jgi:hypothetical protein